MVLLGGQIGLQALIFHQDLVKAIATSMDLDRANISQQRVLKRV